MAGHLQTGCTGRTREILRRAEALLRMTSFIVNATFSPDVIPNAVRDLAGTVPVLTTHTIPSAGSGQVLRRAEALLTMTSLLHPLIHPVVHRLVPELRILRLQDPVAFIREIEHFRRDTL